MKKVTQTLISIFLLASIFTSSLTQPANILAQDSELGSASTAASVEEEVQPMTHLYLFYGEGCPHCGKEQEFLKTLKAEYGDKIQITTFEVYYSPANAHLMETIGNELGLSVSGVPLLFVEDTPIVGFGAAETTGSKIRETIEDCLDTACKSRVDEIVEESGLSGKELRAPEVKGIKEGEEVKNSEQKIIQGSVDQDLNLKVPFLGQVNLKTLSLPVLTLLLGAMDGFNPCAMWILIFLITMLINMEDRRRLFLLGFTFIFVSALVYFAFLAAWFNLFQFIGLVYWVRLLVGLVAIGSGIYHLKNYYEKETGCKVTNSEQRSKLMKRMKNVIQRRNLWLALVGISALAVSVNLIELVCSAGLPAIYTNILSLTDLTTVEYYAYLALYTLIFMIDDLFVFSVAVKTFEVTGITSKYSKMSNLIGGIVILILGILLLFRPQALMFG
jgi:hypothetical protein